MDDVIEPSLVENFVCLSFVIFERIFVDILFVQLPESVLAINNNLLSAFKDNVVCVNFVLCCKFGKCKASRLRRLNITIIYPCLSCIFNKFYFNYFLSLNVNNFSPI